MRNAVTEVLNIRYPIIQASMYYLTNARLAAAVSNAGGLGVLGPHAGQDTPPNSPDEAIERMRQEIRQTKQLTDKPFAVSLLNGPDLAFWRQTAEMFVQEGVEVALINEVLIPEVFAFLKENRIKSLYRALTPTVANSQEAERLGADAIIVTGFDEGGTVPERVMGTFTIVPMIADCVRIPVIATGGITDVRGVRAAFALGAQGVYVGSAFIVAEENPAHPAVKAKIVQSSAEDLVLYRTLPAYYRSLPTPLSDKLVAMDQAGASREEIFNASEGYRSLYQGMRLGNFEKGTISTGTGISLIKAIRPASEIVADFMQDFNA